MTAIRRDTAFSVFFSHARAHVGTSGEEQKQRCDEAGLFRFHTLSVNGGG
jgi:hypothetical protein